MFGAGKCSNHYSEGMDVFIANTLNKYLPSLCFLSLLVTRILLSFIPTMVPCHYSLRRSSRQHTMTAASISAWDVPITHGRVRSHELFPNSSFPFPTHYYFVHFFDAGKLRHPTSGRLYTCRLCCEQTREMATKDKDSPLDRYEVSILNNMAKPLKLVKTAVSYRHP